MTMTSTELKEWREKLGLSQEAFAHVLGVTYLTVSRWERGLAKPSLRSTKLILEAVNKTLNNGGIHG